MVFSFAHSTPNPFLLMCNDYIYYVASYFFLCKRYLQKIKSFAIHFKAKKKTTYIFKQNILFHQNTLVLRKVYLLYFIFICNHSFLNDCHYSFQSSQKLSFHFSSSLLNDIHSIITIINLVFSCIRLLALPFLQTFLLTV